MSGPPSQPGIPSRLLTETEGKKVTVETNDGAVYRGRLTQSEENLSCSLSKVKVVFPSGYTQDMEDVYLRGAKIRFVSLPTEMQDLPLLRERPPTRGRGRGFGGGGRGGGRGRSFHSSYSQRRY